MRLIIRVIVLLNEIKPQYTQYMYYIFLKIRKKWKPSYHSDQTNMYCGKLPAKRNLTLFRPCRGKITK